MAGLMSLFRSREDRMKDYAKTPAPAKPAPVAKPIKRKKPQPSLRGAVDAIRARQRALR